MKLTTLFLSLTLTTCAVMPANIAVQGKYGTYGYSPKSGLSVTINATK